MIAIHKILAGLAVASISLGLVSTADARSVAAWSGKPQDSHYLPCFVESAFSVTQNCSAGGGSLIWEMALPVEAAIPFTPKVNVLAPSSTGQVACAAYAHNSDATGTSAMTSARITPTITGQAQSYSIGPVTVPGEGTLSVACWLAQGGRINSVNW